MDGLLSTEQSTRVHYVTMNTRNYSQMSMIMTFYGNYPIKAEIGQFAICGTRVVIERHHFKPKIGLMKILFQNFC